MTMKVEPGCRVGIEVEQLRRRLLSVAGGAYIHDAKCAAAYMMHGLCLDELLPLVRSAVGGTPGAWKELKAFLGATR